MDEVIEYFVDQYSLIINNTQEMYWPARSAVRAVTKNSGVTLAEYRAMDDEDRNARFAEPIGEAILELIEEWCGEVTKPHDGTPGEEFISAIMRFNGSSLAWSLGENFLPENAEADEFFIDESSDEDDEDHDDEE
jgi:hypothetical protein